MSFSDDVFISYAHLDNQSLDIESEGWVCELHRALTIRVGQILGEQPRVWRDEKLGGNDAFNEVIIGRLRGSAVLVSVLTPRYVRSQWCTRELAEFCNASADTGGLVVRQLSDDGEVITAKERIFKVVKTPVDPDEHPDVIRAFRGYQFFSIDPDSGRVVEFDHVFGEERKLEFWNQLNDLAQDVAALLRLMTDNAPQPTPSRGTVYVAATTTDVRQHYEQIRRDLQGHGYRVLPDRELPLEDRALQEYVSHCLSRSQLSVHVIGGRYGMVAEGSRNSIVELQNELAIDQDARDEFSRLVWIPPGLQTADPRQLMFIDSLRADPHINQGADLLEGSLEDLNTQIHELLEPSAPTPPPAASVNGSGPMLYVICDVTDFTAASAIAAALAASGFKIELPRFDGAATVLREDNERKLRSAHGVVIYCGQGNEFWLHRKLRELRRSAGLGRVAPLLASAVLIAPPAIERIGLENLDVGHVIPVPADFSPQLLEHFLSDLAQRAAG